MSKLSEFTSEELLFEIINREDWNKAPNKISLHGNWHEVIVGIGVDNSIAIRFDDTDFRALTLNNLE